MSLYAKMSCALPRDPRMIQAGPMARLLYMQAVLYCRENLTDGEIDHRILGLVAMDIPDPVSEMDSLCEVGAMEECDLGWRFPMDVWTRWNPTRAEVEEMRSSEAERKRSYRDKKRTGSDVPEKSQRDNSSRDETRKQPEVEPEGERETKGEEVTTMSANADRGPDPVVAVFDAWTTAAGKRSNTLLSEDRRKLIRKQLRHYPVSDLVDAVRGWRHIPHNRGENDSHTVYNDLELLLRDAKHIEKFRDAERGESTQAVVNDPIANVIGRINGHGLNGHRSQAITTTGRTA